MSRDQAAEGRGEDLDGEYEITSIPQDTDGTQDKNSSSDDQTILQVVPLGGLWHRHKLGKPPWWRVREATQPVKTLITQAVAGLVMGLVQLAYGTNYGFSGVTLPQLTRPSTTDLLLDQNQAALFGSLMSLGAVAGTVVCGPLLVRLGQRATLQLGLPLSTAAWLTVAFTPSVWLLQVARFSLGMTASLLTPAASSYILEIAHPRFRGKMAGSMTLAANIGTLVVFFLGSWRLSWRQVAIACAGLSILPIPGIFLLPDSPRWLVTRNRKVKASQALKTIRGSYANLDLEMNAITGQVTSDIGRSGGFWRQLQVLFRRDTLKLLWLLVSLTVFLACCGILPITAYLVPILQEAHTSLDPYTIAVVFAAAKVVGIIVHLCVVDRLGRRPLVIVPFLVCSVCTAAYGVYSFLLITHRVTGIDWMSYTSLVLFNFCNGVGTPSILTLQGELLPNSCRAVGLALLTCLLMLGGFASSYTYPMTALTLGQHGAFWLFSCFSAALVLVAILALPETRGRTLEDITGHTNIEK